MSLAVSTDQVARRPSCGRSLGAPAPSANEPLSACRIPCVDEAVRVVRTVLVVDVVESVRLMQDDEVGTIHRWRAFVDRVANQMLPKHDGRLVKSLGDGLMLEFGHVRTLR